MLGAAICPPPLQERHRAGSQTGPATVTHTARRCARSQVALPSGRAEGGVYLAGDDAMPNVIAGPEGEKLARGQRCLRPLAGQRDGHQGMRACRQRLLIISRDHRREITVTVCVAGLTGVDHEGKRPARISPGRTLARGRIESDHSPEPELFHRGHSLTDRGIGRCELAGSRRHGQLRARCSAASSSHGLVPGRPVSRETSRPNFGRTQERCVSQYLSTTRLAILWAASRPGGGRATAWSAFWAATSRLAGRSSARLVGWSRLAGLVRPVPVVILGVFGALG